MIRRNFEILATMPELSARPRAGKFCNCELVDWLVQQDEIKTFLLQVVKESKLIRLNEKGLYEPIAKDWDQMASEIEKKKVEKRKEKQTEKFRTTEANAIESLKNLKTFNLERGWRKKEFWAWYKENYNTPVMWRTMVEHLESCEGWVIGKDWINCTENNVQAIKNKRAGKAKAFIDNLLDLCDNANKGHTLLNMAKQLAPGAAVFDKAIEKILTEIGAQAFYYEAGGKVYLSGDNGSDDTERANDEAFDVDF